jgi:hypothetical protein
MWAVKGRYLLALADDGTVVWDDQGGKLVLRIAAVRHFHYLTTFILMLRILTG